jgi:hypothetical protein
MALSTSPKELKKQFMAWYNDDKDAAYPAKIYLIYPMLIPKGYDKKSKRWRYKCKHLVYENGKAACTIQDIKPKYPCGIYGEEIDKLIMGIYKPKNKGLYPSCVF